jgi:hypothetical protein
MVAQLSLRVFAVTNEDPPPIWRYILILDSTNFAQAHRCGEREVG